MIRMFHCPLGGTQNNRGDGLFAMNPFVHFRHSKNIKSVALMIAATFIVAFSASGCDKLKARDLLNKGVAAYRDGKFDASIEDFKPAKEPRSHADDRPPVSRHRLRHPVHSRRPLGGKYPHG